MIAVIKQPGETRSFDMPMGLGEGRGVAAIVDVSILPRGLVAETAPLSLDSQSFAGQLVQLALSGGTDGELYLITVTVTDDAGDTVEADAELQVLDLRWTVPADGQAATYIEPSAYVARFGIAETTQLTDEAGAGRIDRATLFAALADAAAEIDSYLARRYAVPLDPAPQLVARLAGEIARERLHGVHTPDSVTRRADAARRSLRDLAEGRATLPGLAVRTDAAGAPLVDAPERIFTRDSLEGW